MHPLISGKGVIWVEISSLGNMTKLCHFLPVYAVSSRQNGLSKCPPKNTWLIIGSMRVTGWTWLNFVLNIIFFVKVVERHLWGAQIVFSELCCSSMFLNAIMMGLRSSHSPLSPKVLSGTFWYFHLLSGTFWYFLVLSSILKKFMLLSGTC